MKKISVAIIMIGLFITFSIVAQNNTTIRARFNNTTIERFYFDFIEQPDANMQFPYKKGVKIDFDTELEDITMLKINSYLLVVVQPGDKIDIEVDYNGRSFSKVKFSGSSEESILASEALARIRIERLNRRYKTNISAALALQTTADDFYKSTLEEWKAEVAVLNEYKSKLSEKVYNFVLSEIDGIFIPNIISYPGNSSIDGFWSVLDDYKLRDDDVSLRNSSYMGVLHIYMRYMQMKKARENNIEFTPPATLEDEYKMTAEFYDGKLRDAALLVFLYSSMSSGKDFDVLEKLFINYSENYNNNPRYLKMLSDVMK